MLIQHVPLLCTKRIVLASASPRRSELLRGLGLKVEVLPSTFEENLDKSGFANPGEYATETAMHKAIDVSQQAAKASFGRRADLIIAADTVVELHSQVLEKPFDKDDAYRMLSSLSGQKHKVYTGVALVLPNASDSAPGAPPLVKSFYEETEVEFAELEEEAILAYIASGEPMDKAGAYGIQGIGGSFVKCIHGCYFNIMGFPVHRFSVEVDRLVKNGAIKA
ncbi:hypothetical protein M758_1G312300 [Ceratodon purpureus]|uniref:Maf-like protein n=1 Tax=Ceratodon purpureus TaxID=3225 RepID=A0A8T0JBL5_CERPU|nr:hypothetical protein KC19_1G319200 [Ceratodon purpureus]KAG0632216.1 hypothetical protein M758_1G312300 [Ceratodon purpureus]